jgi:hypothetical protein
MNQRLCHDCSVAMSWHLLELLGNLIDECDKQAAWEEFYCICKGGLEAYEEMGQRQAQRLNPSKN